MHLFPDKDQGESPDCTFEFNVDDIVSAVVTATVLKGDDPYVDAMVYGSPAVVDGSNVVQRITGGVNGNDYRLLCAATRADGEVRYLAARMRVRTST